MKAKSIINMLKALQEDYDFIEIKEHQSSESDFELKKELDKRYKSFQKDAKGKDWEVLKDN